MCYYVDTQITRADIKKIYGVNFEGEDYRSTPFLNGFTHAAVPVILDENPTVCTSAVWGLIPFWAKDRKIQKQTLNARIDTIKEKPSFRNNYNKRCLVLVRGFYEWKWLDDKGKAKHKHYLMIKNQELFSLGGIYSHWTDTDTGEDLTSFSIVTTDANELMTEIHNSKRRMPVVLYRAMEREWLQARAIEDFAFPNHESELAALNLDEPSVAHSLF